MIDVKRYNPDVFGDMRENPAGEYVRSLDFDKVAADLQEFKNGNTMSLLRAGFAKACEERDALSAQLRDANNLADQWAEKNAALAAQQSAPDRVSVPVELLQDLHDLASDAVEHHRAAFAGYKLKRQANMDDVVDKARAILASHAEGGKV